MTESGNTFAMANVVANMNKPTLILVHNRTLAAQLYEKIMEIFPKGSRSVRLRKKSGALKLLVEIRG